jgi:hypothetical protein
VRQPQIRAAGYNHQKERNDDGFRSPTQFIYSIFEKSPQHTKRK